MCLALTRILLRARSQARDHVYSLIYHDLVQKKRQMLPIHKMMLKTRAEASATSGGTPLLSAIAANETHAILCNSRVAMEQFMSEHAYRILS